MKATVTRLPRGFSLVEVTLALGVAAFCLVALFGLMPIGISSNQTTLEQTAAASVAANVVADLRSTPVVFAATSPAPAAVSKQYGIQIPTTPNSTNLPTYTLFLREDGSMAQSTTTPQGATGWKIDLSQYPRYRVTLVFNPPAAGQVGVTPVRVLVTWPAIADPNPALSSTDTVNFPSKFSGSFETVTALDRN